MRLARVGRWLFGLILLLAAASAGGVWYLSGSLPQTSGTMSVAGIERPVRILRDDNGVPHIFAQTEADAYFAMGVVHAQDRLWQMETLRRVALGRLSEIIGPATIEIDTFLRAMGFESRLAGDFAALEAPVRLLVESYAAGVNAGIAGLDRLPPEFLALRTEPEPWRAIDSLLVSKLMSVRLGDNRRRELLHAAMTARLEPGFMKSLYPEWDEADEAIFRDTVVASRDFAGAIPVPKLAGVPGGYNTASNAWAVGGKRSSTGKPLVANDPHLGLEAPIIWYLARVNVAGRDVIGGTLPGLPFHVLGQNGHIAWGLTTTGADTEDLFIEKVAEADPTRYETPNGTLPFRSETVTIGVKGEEPLVVKLRHTRHGRVISDIDQDIARMAGKRHVVALATASTSAPDTSMAVAWYLAHAKSWSEAREALRLMVAPVQNFTIADADGNVALKVAGLVPVRRSGSSLLPAPGWTGTHDWGGFVPFDDLPEQVVGPGGRVVNANNQWGPSQGPTIAHQWQADLRYRRAVGLVDARPVHDFGSFRAIQLDAHSADADLLLPTLLALVKPNEGPAIDAVKRLTSWNRKMTTDSIGASIFEAWLRELGRAVFADELRDAFPAFWGWKAPLVARHLSGGSRWCDNINTAGVKEDCAQTAASALDAALAWLSANVSKSPDDWQWGRLHRVQLKHAIFKRIPGLAWWTDLSRPTPGGHYTLNRGGGPAAPDDQAFLHTHGSSYRAIYDLADPARSRFVTVTGQSGNPLSRHWGDLVARWLSNDLIAISGSPDDLAARGADSLVLEPASR